MNKLQEKIINVFENIETHQQIVLSEKIEKIFTDDLLIEFCKYHFMRFNVSNKDDAEKHLIIPFLDSYNKK